MTVLGAQDTAMRLYIGIFQVSGQVRGTLPPTSGVNTTTSQLKSPTISQKQHYVRSHGTASRPTALPKVSILRHTLLTLDLGFNSPGRTFPS